jgi:hypothetical protein
MIPFLIPANIFLVFDETKKNRTSTCFVDFNLGVLCQNSAQRSLLVIPRAKIGMSAHKFVCARTRNEPKTLGAKTKPLLCFQIKIQICR